MKFIVLIFDIGLCTFRDGYITGGDKKNMGIAQTEDECANMVKTKIPDARGVSYTWTVMHKDCNAQYIKPSHIGRYKLRIYSYASTNVAKRRYCFFPGRTFSHY